MKVLDSSVLRVHRLLRRRPMVELSRITSEREHLEILKETLSDKSIGIYVHIPFCKSICMFCPYFKQVLRSREELNTYLETLLRELDLYGKVLRDLSLSVVEIHIGGGTPSVSPLTTLNGICEYL